MTKRLLAAAIVAATWSSSGLSASLAQEPAHATGYVFHDRNSNGTRDAGEEGLAGVPVSNQLEIVRTDGDGRWQLPVDDDTTLFVVKPRDWMTAVDPVRQLPRFYYTHKPNGSPPLKYPGVEPTGSLPESIDFALRPRTEPDRFQAIFFGDTQPRDVKEVGYMLQDVVPELVGTDAAFGVTLGDIVFDDLSVFEPHNRAVALIGIPWYNVIGNHDENYDAPGDALSDETYERHYGPNYYAFDYGPVHFIVLDNVCWQVTEEGKQGNYHAELGETQLAFVKNDLALVPQDKLVILMTHIPLPGTKDREALYRLIETRPHCLSVSGHTHFQAHEFITSEDGWRGPKPHHHVINVTVCGSWWKGEPDELGIPHATMWDGAPNGYSIFTFDGTETSIEFKAARRDACYQMNVYAPNVVPADKAAETEVLANVFGGSERSAVEMRVGDDGPWLPMARVERPDPAFVAMKKSEEGRKLLGRPLPEARTCHHLWAAHLPADAPRGLTLIHVRTTDMFGHTYEASRAIWIR